jgi:hypothetical protein
MKRYLLVPVLGALVLAVAAPASAQWGGRDSRQSYGYSSDGRRVAYDRGFREGISEGENDGRRGDAFRYQDERDFRRADIGYNRSYGDLDRYRQNFRQGFADGYAQGYRRYAGRYGNNGRYGSGDRGYGYPQGRNDRYLTPFDIGARDGYEKGREDARDNDRFDPRRHKWYREGDHDYNSRYGSRDRYKDEYRRGFTQGYERGYRAYR